MSASFFKRHWKLITLALLVLAAIGGILQKQEDAKKGQAAQATPATASTSAASTPAPMAVTAPNLFADYEANEVSADEKYKGKTLDVQGRVETIGKDIVDSMYVTLDINKPMSIGNVQCMFDGGHKAELTQLKKGQKVTLRGEVSGKMGNVLMRNCAIVSK